MSEFVDEMTDRVREASASLVQAEADGDDYLVDVRIGELESLARSAAEHGIEIPGLSGTLAARQPAQEVQLPADDRAPAPHTATA